MLTVKELDRLKVTDKGKVLRDGGSLYGRVQVSRQGVVEVSFTYRYRHEGKVRETRVGIWPTTKLTDIRANRDALKVSIDNGNPPPESTRRKREVSESPEPVKEAIELTWTELFNDWMQVNAGERDGHWVDNLKSLWNCHLAPSLADLPLSQAKRQPLMAHYAKQKKAGKDYTARRALEFMLRLAKYARTKGLPEDHELLRLELPAKTVKRVRENQRPDRFDIEEFFAAHGEDAAGNEAELDQAGRALQFAELVTLLHDLLPASTQADSGKCLVRLMLATGIRAKEAVSIRWKWVSLERRVMIIPAGGMKKRRMHHVHLSEFTLTQLAKMAEVRKNEFVFPAPISENAHIRRDNVGTDVRLRQFYRTSEETEAEHLGRLDERMKVRRCRQEYALYNLPGGVWTLYDMRRTVATRLEELGFEREQVSAVLAHAKDDAETTGRYARFSHWETRCAALDAIGKALAACESGTLPY